jgi:hypothetical protein
MKELIAKLKETLELAERKITESNKLIEENNAFRLELNSQQKEHTDRFNLLNQRESNVEAVENLRSSQEELRAEKDRVSQEALRLKAKEESLDKDYQEKLKSLEDDRKLLGKQQEELTAAQLQLSEERKNYRQQVIDAVHKESTSRLK